jgi:hypothetical protein
MDPPFGTAVLVGHIGQFSVARRHVLALGRDRRRPLSEQAMAHVDDEGRRHADDQADRTIEDRRQEGGKQARAREHAKSDADPATEQRHREQAMVIPFFVRCSRRSRALDKGAGRLARTAMPATHRGEEDPRNHGSRSILVPPGS